MAQFSTRRRTLACSDTNPLPPSPPPPPLSPPPASFSASVPTETDTKTLDPTNLVLMSSHFSRLNPSHQEVPTPTNTKDIHMQSKSMTLSTDSVSLIKPTGPRKNLLKGEMKPSKDLYGKTQQREKMGLRKKDLLGTITPTKVSQGKGLEASGMSVSSLLGRRRSLDGSRVELGDILANCGVRIVSVDMPPFMQIHAVDFARKTHDSLEKFSPKSLALSLKKEFDGVYGPAWHCIVGTSFGSFVTHSVGGFLYFSMDQKLYFLLFKTTVQRAD